MNHTRDLKVTAMIFRKLFPKRFIKSDSGVAAIEFVFVLPFLMFLYFGMIDLTGLISNNRKVTQAADAVSNLVTQNRTTVIKGDLNDYYKVVEMIMKPTSMSEVRVEFYGFRPTGASVNQIWTANNGSGPGCGALPTSAALLPLTTAGNDLVVGRVCMLYTPAIGTFLGTKLLGKTSFLVKEEITQRPRSTPRLDCRISTGGALC
jgi:Flp pilus assembly protein TadG